MVVFHNGQGSMCLDFLDYIETIDYEVEEHLVGESDFNTLLSTYKTGFEESLGVSEDFGYYPIIFVEGRAYSGFNDDIEKEINNLIE